MKSIFEYGIGIIMVLVVFIFIWSKSSNTETVKTSASVDVVQMIADDFAKIKGDSTDNRGLVFYESQITLANGLDSTYNAHITNVLNVFQEEEWCYQVNHTFNDSTSECTIEKVKGFWVEDRPININSILPLQNALEAVANSELDADSVTHITIRKILGPNPNASENGFYQFGLRTCVDLTTEEVITFKEMEKRVFTVVGSYTDAVLKNDSISQ